MEISANIEKKKFECLKKIGQSQVVVECDIDVEGKGGVEKLLSVNGRVVSSKVEVSEGNAKITGNLSFKVLYLDKNNELRSVEYLSEFLENIGSSALNSDSIARCELRLVDIDHAHKVNDIRLQAVVDVMLYAVDRCACDVLMGSSDAICKNENIKTSMHICSIDQNTTITEEYNAGCNIDSVLVFDQDAYVLEVVESKDKVSVTGEAVVNIVYVSDGKEVSKDITIPFSEEVKGLGIDVESVATIKAQVIDSKIVLGGVEDNNDMSINLTLKLIGDVFDYIDDNCVSDIYSSQCELDIAREDVTFNMPIMSKYVKERVQGELELDDNIKKLVLLTRGIDNMANAKIEQDNIVVDALFSVNAVYINSDDVYVSKQINLPACINIPCKDIDMNDVVDVDVYVEGISGKVKRETDIDISMKVVLVASVNRNMCASIINSVNVLSEKVNSHKSISIYFVKAGDSIWDIAKALDYPMDKITSFNKNVDFDNLKGGEKVIIVR